MHALSIDYESPQRRLASPSARQSLQHFHVDQDQEPLPLLKNSQPITSPRRTSSSSSPSSVVTSRRIQLLIGCVGFLIVEFIWRGIVMSLSNNSSSNNNNSPCDMMTIDKEKQVTTILSSTIINTNHSSIVVSTSSNNNNTVELNFAILGFPKTGSSFLTYALNTHSQVIMPPDGTAPYEFCQIHHKEGHVELLDWLLQLQKKNATDSSESTTKIKHGIKCPTMVRAVNAIENLMKVSKRTKLVVGVRHPVLWFQSFYNYRVYNKYSDPKSYPEPIPSPFSLTNKKHWRDVSMAYARYDTYLKQLMKVPLQSKEITDMLITDAFWEKRMIPNPYPIFIYNDEQLNDDNTTRSDMFRRELQHFLELDSPLVDFNSMPRINTHDDRVVYPEQINICNDTYVKIRKTLVEAGIKSSKWIVDKFINADDVFVGNRNHFVEQLYSWRTDPCK